MHTRNEMNYTIPNLSNYVKQHNKSKKLNKPKVTVIDPLLKSENELRQDDIDYAIAHLEKLGMSNLVVITSKNQTK